MTASVAAARACASTLLFDCLRIDAFQCATPHVMLVLDHTPCTQQKVLVEGYRQVLEELNGTLPSDAVEKASNGALYVPLTPSATTPCGASGLTQTSATSLQPQGKRKITYSIAPFKAGCFMRDMQRLQAFFRLCGENEKEEGTLTEASACVSAEEFERRFAEVEAYLLPLPAVSSSSSISCVATEEKNGETRLRPTVALPDEAARRTYCDALRVGERRELLGFILVQRHAFQNELRQYRLRLALFNMGMRVAEHCHLESMSTTADALAAAGDLQAAMEDDQVRTYAQACAFPPFVTESLAKGIADAIDLQAWQRAGQPDLRGEQKEGHESGGVDAASQGVPPPPTLVSCLANEEVQALFQPGSLTWASPASSDAVAAAAAAAGSDDASKEAYETTPQQPITGPGAPLRIITKQSTEEENEGRAPCILSFHGGLEDCLMNTGYYAAAYQPERNNADAHRLRFPNHMCEGSDAQNDAAKKVDGGVEEKTQQRQQEDQQRHGRQKKQEYLAALRARGERPNKPSKAKTADHDSDADERDENTHARPTDGGEGKGIGNSIGGTFPIGEVISEAFDLSKLSGTCRVFAYPGSYKEVTMSQPQPFAMTIEEGCVTAVSDDCPADFVDLLSLVRQAEGGKCYVRELGIGLNPFTNRHHVLADVTSFERQWGIHLSLGQRHPLFVKQKARRNADGSVADAIRIDGPVLKRKAGKYHIDVFIDAARLEMGSFTMDFTKGVAVA